MNFKSLLALVLCCGLAACASAPQPGSPGAVGPGKQNAPMQVGPDIIANVPLAAAWTLISDVDHWQDWNSQLSGVTHTAALAEGSALIYQDGGKRVDATVVTLKDQDQLAWEGALCGSHAHLHWTLKALDPQRTLVSLRAELQPDASPKTVGAAGAETSQWIEAVQVALAKQAAALPSPTPVPPRSRRQRHAPLQP